MKFRITEGANSINGERIYYVYEVGVDGTTRYMHGAAKLEDARAFVQRKLNPKAEILIEEIGS
jgi:hypothetical protein